MTAAAPEFESNRPAVLLPHRINKGSRGGLDSAIRALASMTCRIN